MCQHTQYVMRQDSYPLFVKGYRTLVCDGLAAFRPIYEQHFIRSKKGVTLNFTRLIGSTNSIIRRYVSHETNIHNEPIHTCKTKSERFSFLKYYCEYNIEPERYSLLNEFTGDMLPLFIPVSCGNCAICNEKKKNITSNRSFLASAHYGTPFFVTLTYNEEEYKIFDEKYSSQIKETIVDEIQKFIKRLRKHLADNNHTKKLQYIAVSERGSKRYRIHYHLLIWYNDDELRELKDCKEEKPNGSIAHYKTPRFTDYVKKSWKKGNVLVELSKDNSGKYCYKYMSKSISNVKLQSKSLGKETFLQYAEQLKHNPEITSFDCFNPYTQESKKIAITNWMTNIIYPSLSRSLPCRMRRIIDMCFEIFYRYKDKQYFRDQHNHFINLLRNVPIDYDMHDYNSTSTDMEKRNYIVDKNRYIKLKHQLYRYFDSINFLDVAENVALHDRHHAVVVTNLPDDYTTYLNKINQNAVLFREKEIDNQ